MSRRPGEGTTSSKRDENSLKKSVLVEELAFDLGGRYTTITLR